jgi:anaerobic selenocysteine-containing dehydrogenase
MLVTVENGVATSIRGDPDMPFTEGTLCTKVAHYLERTYAPDRLLYPQRRIGPKGSGQFKRIGWDEALDEIAARLKALAAEDPETILPCSYAGTMGMVQYMSMDRRFFHKLGASLLDRTLCSSAGKAGIKATLGASVGMDPERFDEARLILLWGANPVVSNLHLWSRVQAAKRRGAKIVAIDPYRSLSAEKCTQHIALLPGTDGALALGMMHVLISEGLLTRLHNAIIIPRSKSALEKYSRRGRRRLRYPVEEVVSLVREYGTTAGGDPPTMACSATRRDRGAHYRMPAALTGGGAMRRAVLCHHRGFLA